MLPRLSLTHRLTLFFTLVASSVVLGLGGLFMAAADQHFVYLARGALQDKPDSIGEIIATNHYPNDFEPRSATTLNSHHRPFFVCWRGVLFLRDRVIYGSSCSLV